MKEKNEKWNFSMYEINVVAITISQVILISFLITIISQLFRKSWRMQTNILICFFFTSIKSGAAITGYDCTKEPRDAMRFSVVDVEPCPKDLKGWYEPEEPVEVQVIRLPS